MASGPYQTSTSVASSAGRPSTGWYWENPVSRAAVAQTGSSSLPSMTTEASLRGSCTWIWLARPLNPGVESWPRARASAMAGSMGGEFTRFDRSRGAPIRGTPPPSLRRGRPTCETHSPDRLRSFGAAMGLLPASVRDRQPQVDHAPDNNEGEEDPAHEADPEEPCSKRPEGIRAGGPNRWKGEPDRRRHREDRGRDREALAHGAGRGGGGGGRIDRGDHGVRGAQGDARLAATAGSPRGLRALATTLLGVATAAPRPRDDSAYV